MLALKGLLGPPRSPVSAAFTHPLLRAGHLALQGLGALRPQEQQTQTQGSPVQPTAGCAVALHLSPAGATIPSSIVGVDPLPGLDNYFQGNDPSRWLTDIPTYGAVTYQHVYTGIDLVFHGGQDKLEYDWDVAAGANPGLIDLSLTGVQSVQLDSQGDLLLQTPAGTVIQPPPVAYQTINGVQQPVSATYTLLGSADVGFALGTYDPSQPLLIDPALVYSTYLDSGWSGGTSIAVDSSGNAYVAEFSAAGYYLNGNAVDAWDTIVTKLSADGSSVLYRTVLGGTGQDIPSAIAVDSAGDAYVAGTSTFAADYPTTPGAYQRSFTLATGSDDGFLSKLSSDGRQLLYSTYLAPNGGDWATGLMVTNAGVATVVGGTANGTSGVPLVVQIDTTQNAVGSPLPLASSDQGWATGIAADSAGNLYISGTADAPGFSTTSGAVQTTLRGQNNVFLTKLNAAHQIVYSTLLGGSATDYSFGVAADGSGAAYVTGISWSEDFPLTALLTAGSGIAPPFAFVTKIDTTKTSASNVVYSVALGGSRVSADDTAATGQTTPDTWGTGIAVDGTGDAYVTGYTNLTDFPVVNAPQTTYGGGPHDAFVAELNPTGRSLVYSTYLGGGRDAYGRGGDDMGDGIALDKAGNAYVTGATSSPTFPLVSAEQGYYIPSLDAFITEVDPMSIPSAPAYTHSHYVNTTNSQTLNTSGCNQGVANEQGVIILDFGQPAYQNNTYGSYIFDTNASFLSTTQIESLVKSFIAGYFLCAPSSSYTDFVVGTNNYAPPSCTTCSLTTDHGKAWAQMINDLNNWVQSPPSFASKVIVGGGIDAEMAWSSATSALQWSTGYNSIAQYADFDYGSCDGCPTGYTYQSTPSSPGQLVAASVPTSYGSVTDPSCQSVYTNAYCWTQEQIYSIAWGIPSAFPLPEIYYFPPPQSSTQANEWEDVALYSAKNHSSMLFFGPVTTYENDSTSNSPSQGWTQLYQSLSSDKHTQESSASALSWLTDIKTGF